MKQEAIQKINKMGHAGQIITNILKAFVGIGIALALFSTIFLIWMPDELFNFKLDGMANITMDPTTIGAQTTNTDREKLEKEFEDLKEEMTFSVDGTEYGIIDMQLVEDTIQMKANGTIADVTPNKLAWVAFSALLQTIMTMVTLFFVGALCKAFRNCQSPFENNVIIKMRNFAFSLIPWVVLSSVSNSAMEALFSEKMTFQLSANVNIIFAVLVILALTYIFKYGAVLQQESDETL